MCLGYVASTVWNFYSCCNALLLSQWWIQGVQQVQMHPLQRILKNTLLIAIFQGFWPIAMFLCVSYYWERPSHLKKVKMSSYKPYYNQEFA